MPFMLPTVLQINRPGIRLQPVDGLDARLKRRLFETEVTGDVTVLGQRQGRTA